MSEQSLQNSEHSESKQPGPLDALMSKRINLLAESIVDPSNASIDWRKEVRRKTFEDLRDAFTPLCYLFAKECLNINNYESLSAPSSYVASYNWGLIKQWRYGASLERKERQSFSTLRDLVNINTGGVPKFKWECLSGQFKDYCWMEQDPGHEMKNPFLQVDMLPVGAYGAKHSARVLAAVQSMSTIARNVLSLEAEQVFKNAPLAVWHGTARVNDLPESPLNGPLRALIEGTQSIAHALSLALAEPISGCANAEEAMRAVINANIPNSLAAITPMGFVGPARFKGRYIPGLLTVDSQGVLSISLEARERIKLARNKAFEGRDTSLEKIAALTGFGCPVSRRGNNDMSGIAAISHALLQVYLYQTSDIPDPICAP